MENTEDGITGEKEKLLYKHLHCLTELIIPQASDTIQM